MDLDAVVGSCEVTGVPDGGLRLVWVRPLGVVESADEPGPEPGSGALKLLDGYRVSRVPWTTVDHPQGRRAAS